VNPLADKITAGNSDAAVEASSIDRMIKKVEEKVNEKANEKKTAGVKAHQPAGERVKIFTKDGNIFIGTIVKETSDEIVINSSLGSIRINKSRISRRINL
jgi:hypothetical protein